MMWLVLGKYGVITRPAGPNTEDLVQSALAHLIYSHTFIKPSEVFELLTGKSWVLCLQTGEYGPITQCIAGIDIAMHDLFARRNFMPLSILEVQEMRFPRTQVVLVR